MESVIAYERPHDLDVPGDVETSWSSAASAITGSSSDGPPTSHARTGRPHCPSVVAALCGGNEGQFMGNGGSSMDAGHLAAELTGR